MTITTVHHQMCMAIIELVMVFTSAKYPSIRAISLH